MQAINPDTGQLADLKELQKSSDGEHWSSSNSDEIGRLAQGRHPKTKEGSNTMRFIKRAAIPKGRKPTYLRVVCDDRPQKAEKRRVRWTAGGDKVDYPFACATKTAELATVKTLINSVISTPKARFMTMDIKDFYLNTQLPRPEFMRIPVDIIPQDIYEQYNLVNFEENGCVCVQVDKTIYGLPQAGRLSNDAFVTNLAKDGYVQSKRTPGLFQHNTKPIAFTLVVDDFGVKHVGRQHAEHLEQTLRKHYRITTDWEGALYCGITLKWDYEKGTVELSMPGHIDRALQRFQHPTPSKAEEAPHTWTKPTHGAKIQCAADADTTALLDKKWNQTSNGNCGNIPLLCASN